MIFLFFLTVLLLVSYLISLIIHRCTMPSAAAVYYVISLKSISNISYITFSLSSKFDWWLGHKYISDASVLSMTIYNLWFCVQNHKHPIPPSGKALWLPSRTLSAVRAHLLFENFGLARYIKKVGQPGYRQTIANVDGPPTCAMKQHFIILIACSTLTQRPDTVTGRIITVISQITSFIVESCRVKWHGCCNDKNIWRSLKIEDGKDSAANWYSLCFHVFELSQEWNYARYGSSECAFSSVHSD